MRFSKLSIKLYSHSNKKKGIKNFKIVKVKEKTKFHKTRTYILQLNYNDLSLQIKNVVIFNNKKEKKKKKL